MKQISEIIMALPSIKLMEDSKNISKNFWLPAGGFSAFQGALRVFPSHPIEDFISIEYWNSPKTWKKSYKHLAPDWVSIGEDAFGTQYLLNPDRTEISLFWPETAEVENLNISPSEFILKIIEDPDNTISFSFYKSCVSHYGNLPLNKHFTFRVELAVGGILDVENISPMDSLEHMNALGSIALQLKEIPFGSLLKPVQE